MMDCGGHSSSSHFPHTGIKGAMCATDECLLLLGLVVRWRSLVFRAAVARSARCVS